MSKDIDDLLKPDNMDDNKKDKKDTTDKIKSRLNDLKEAMKSDPVQLNTDSLLFDGEVDLPLPNEEKYIDYAVEEKKRHREFAEQSITNIINTYIKSEKLLNTPRLKDYKQLDILNYSALLLTLQMSESNLIKLQEAIDSGDMSKEMFDSVNKAQQEFRANLNAINLHLAKCEKYWKDYSSNYGFESEEEKIVQETEVKDDTEKRVIINMSELTETIYKIAEQKKADELKNKEDSK